jgi:hypothetical protein
MIFAEELPTSAIVPNNAVVIVICIWVVLTIVGAGGGLIAVVIALRRKPSIDAEFATKQEVAQGFARVDADLLRFNARNEELARQIFVKVDGLGASINHEFSSLNRSVGKLEGTQDLAKQIAEAIKK